MRNDADLSFFVSVCYSTKENVFCLKNEDRNESGGQCVSTQNKVDGSFADHRAKVFDSRNEQKTHQTKLNKISGIFLCDFLSFLKRM